MASLPMLRLMTNVELCPLCKLGIPSTGLDKHIKKHANSDYEISRLETIVNKKIASLGLVTERKLVKPIVRVA